MTAADACAPQHSHSAAEHAAVKAIILPILDEELREEIVKVTARYALSDPALKVRFGPYREDGTRHAMDGILAVLVAMMNQQQQPAAVQLGSCSKQRWIQMFECEALADCFERSMLDCGMDPDMCALYVAEMRRLCKVLFLRRFVMQYFEIRNSLEPSRR